jgi:hypothetical protein
MSDPTAIPAQRPEANTAPASADPVNYTQPVVPPLPDAGVDAAGSLDLAPSVGVDQTYSLDLEATEVDPFRSRGGDYPEFSYADQTHTQPIPDPVDPNPFPAVSNYVQPTVPSPSAPTAVADLSIAGSSGFATSASGPAGVPAVYQSYPAAAPVHDPIRYDYGYNTQAVVDHPNALPSLLLGIASLVLFTPAGIVGLILAQKGRREVAANPGRWVNGGTLTAGFVLSLIGTILTGLIVAVVVGMILVMIVAGASF